MPEEKGRLVSEVLEEIYAGLDEVMAKAAVQMKTTCTKGCDSCCYLLATITFAEGILIAERLVRKPDWHSLLPKLRQSSLDHCYEGINESNYFSKKLPCVFLDTKEKTCTIYETRPGTCRYYYVASHPSICSPDHPTGRVAIINTKGANGDGGWQEPVWGLSFKVAAERGIQDVVAPIPLMVLFCLFMLVDEGGKGRRLIREAAKGLPTPSQWLEAHPSVFERENRYGDNGEPITAEELEKMRKPDGA